MKKKPLTPKRVVPQPMKKAPAMSVKNAKMQSLGNTHAQVKKSPPGGMLHSKVATAPVNLPTGQYL